MPERVRVAIVGAGLSGICAAAALRRAGIEDFVLLEKAEDVGGTWRDNTYPGCTCDVPSLLYSFSFAPSAEWTRFFAPQPEIQRYVHDVVAREGLLERVRGGTEVRGATWSDEEGWLLDTSTGPISAQVMIAGAGPWHEPLTPDLAGLENFEGTVFHSSRWDHGHDLAGRRVAVVGSGASAVQFVPEIQPAVSHLTLFQRTPHWVLPKLDRATTSVERWALRHVPGVGRLARGALFNLFEALNAAMRYPRAMRQLQRLGELNLRRGIRDPELRAKLTPDFTLGCKRILISNEWYPALARRNVTVVPAAVERVLPNGVVDANGAEHEVDTIVFGTGFQILDMPVADLVRGRDGRTLGEVWQGSPRGYLGTVTSGFPNAFVMLGPNLGINTAATVLMEAQARYVVDAIEAMDREGIGALDVRADVQDRFNARVDAALEGTVWNAGGCRSYFLDANGRNGFMYPWSARHLQRRLAAFDLSVYETQPLRSRARVAA